MLQLQSFSGGCLLSLILVQLFPEALSSATGHAEVPLSGMNIQGSTRRRALGLVNFVPALAFRFCLNLPAEFAQPWAHLLVEPCTKLANIPARRVVFMQPRVDYFYTTALIILVQFLAPWNLRNPRLGGTVGLAVDREGRPQMLQRGRWRQVSEREHLQP